MHGIGECFGRKSRGFTGITVTHGGGNDRNHGLRKIIETRKREQKNAARLGRYVAQFLLNHSSRAVKDPKNVDMVADLRSILAFCRPRTIYTHCLTDKHDTHVAVVLRVIEALRRLPKSQRPGKLVGCAVWRGLDWMCDSDKVAMPISSQGAKMGRRLINVFKSQIKANQRLNEAVPARWMADAVFFKSHGESPYTAVSWGMDMTPLLQKPLLDPIKYAKFHVDRFSNEVQNRIRNLE